MVQIEVQEDYKPTPTTTKAFARRSSTPLITTICGDCVEDTNPLIPSSFCKWKQKLGRPILYQVLKCLDQSIYTPIEQHRIAGEKPRNNQLREDILEKIMVAKKMRLIWSGDVFLDPAVMGIKRAADAVTSPHGGHNGLEFIRNFNSIYLRPRQCSYIEAKLKDIAQQQQRHLRYQTAYRD